MPRKPKALTPAERQARRAEAKRKAGLVPRMVWARPEHWEDIKRFVAGLTQRPSAK